MALIIYRSKALSLLFHAVQTVLLKKQLPLNYDFLKKVSCLPIFETFSRAVNQSLHHETMPLLSLNLEKSDFLILRDYS